MHLQAYCSDCNARYEVGYLGNLPQTTRLMSELAEIFHGHECKSLDIELLSA